MKNENIDFDKLERVITGPIFGDREEELRRQKYIDLVYRSMRRGRIIRRSIWIASSATVMLILVWRFILPPQEKINAEAIYAEFYRPAVFQSAYRSYNGENSAFRDALKKYGANEFQSALPLTDSLLVMQNPPDPDLLFLAASVYQANKVYAKAESCYKALVPFGVSYRQEALWYLALISLRSDNVALCRAYLKQIIESGNGGRKKSADALLRRIAKLPGHSVS